eukprot:c12843_g1_i1.p1 GENE.c12843_g1_i1~~c12843_g1_i1.p1  ORF type:complete len:1359 (-),score=353.68 c12843_g1_i1:1047-5021(-)
MDIQISITDPASGNQVVVPLDEQTACQILYQLTANPNNKTQVPVFLNGILHILDATKLSIDQLFARTLNTIVAVPFRDGKLVDIRGEVFFQEPSGVLVRCGMVRDDGEIESFPKDFWDTLTDKQLFIPAIVPVPVAPREPKEALRGIMPPTSRSPPPTFDSGSSGDDTPQLSNLPDRIAIIHDAENCHIPFDASINGSSLYDTVVREIVSLITGAPCHRGTDLGAIDVDWKLYNSPATPRIYCPHDVTLEALKIRGVMHISAPTKKGSVDFMVIDEMQRYLNNHKDDRRQKKEKSVLAILSGDRDNSTLIRNLRSEKIIVVCLHSTSLNKAFLDMFDPKLVRGNWNQLVESAKGGSSRNFPFPVQMQDSYGNSNFNHTSNNNTNTNVNNTNPNVIALDGAKPYYVTRSLEGSFKRNAQSSGVNLVFGWEKPRAQNAFDVNGARQNVTRVSFSGPPQAVAAAKSAFLKRLHNFDVEFVAMPSSVSQFGQPKFLYEILVRFRNAVLKSVAGNDNDDTDNNSIQDGDDSGSNFGLDQEISIYIPQFHALPPNIRPAIKVIASRSCPTTAAALARRFKAFLQDFAWYDFKFSPNVPTNVLQTINTLQLARDFQLQAALPPNKTLAKGSSDVLLVGSKENVAAARAFLDDKATNSNKVTTYFEMKPNQAQLTAFLRICGIFEEFKSAIAQVFPASAPTKAEVIESVNSKEKKLVRITCPAQEEQNAINRVATIVENFNSRCVTRTIFLPAVEHAFVTVQSDLAQILCEQQSVVVISSPTTDLRPPQQLLSCSVKSIRLDVLADEWKHVVSGLDVLILSVDSNMSVPGRVASEIVQLAGPAFVAELNKGSQNDVKVITQVGELRSIGICGVVCVCTVGVRDGRAVHSALINGLREAALIGHTVGIVPTPKSPAVTNGAVLSSICSFATQPSQITRVVLFEENKLSGDELAKHVIAESAKQLPESPQVSWFFIDVKKQNIEIPKDQVALIESAIRAGDPSVVLLFNSMALDVNTKTLGVTDLQTGEQGIAKKESITADSFAKVTFLSQGTQQHQMFGLGLVGESTSVPTAEFELRQLVAGSYTQLQTVVIPAISNPKPHIHTINSVCAKYEAHAHCTFNNSLLELEIRAKVLGDRFSTVLHNELREYAQKVIEESLVEVVYPREWSGQARNVTLSPDCPEFHYVINLLSQDQLFFGTIKRVERVQIPEHWRHYQRIAHSGVANETMLFYGSGEMNSMQIIFSDTGLPLVNGNEIHCAEKPSWVHSNCAHRLPTGEQQLFVVSFLMGTVKAEGQPNPAQNVHTVRRQVRNNNIFVGHSAFQACPRYLVTYST